MGPFAYGKKRKDSGLRQVYQGNGQVTINIEPLTNKKTPRGDFLLL